MGCAASSESPNHRRRSHDSGWSGRSKREPIGSGDWTEHRHHRRDSTPPRDPTPPPPPRDPTPPPPRDPTPPPPRDPTPPPPRDPTPQRDPTPPPPRDPTPPPPRDPTPQRDPTPPPRDPTPPPPRDPTPEEHTQKGEQREGYTCTEYGIYEKSYDFRSHPTELDRVYSEPPSERPYTDRDFGAAKAIQGERVDWKRPGEFCDNPVLFSDGTTRYDIGQGTAGTCWFLSMVAMLADKPALFHRVVPKDAWDQEGGVFHCYFLRFGEWEDVYIDDYLPIVHGNMLWGAKSKDDPNEMWPALLEKAFARFHGNYNAVYGGQSGDAFLALTGGCSEYIDFDKDLEADADGDEMTKARRMHARLKNSIASGSMLTTEVPQEYDGHCGLIGGHAYSLTGVTTVMNNRGNEVNLVRVRNPWGHTEWKGAWSDGGCEWQDIPENAVKHANKDDGEFWMSLRDFIKYFSGITVCSMTPDFDKDGCTDSINVCTTILGDWVGKKAAGFQNRIANPRYMFCVDDEGMDDEGNVPLVLQICQKLRHRQKDKASIRVDLYSVVGADKCQKQNPLSVVMLLGDTTNVYKTERQMSNRYKVQPGYYVAVPSTINAGTEKEYLVRIFSPNVLHDVSEMGSDFVVMETSELKPPVCHGVDNKLKTCECFFGAWNTGHNAGGQVSHPTFFTNPQLEFEVPDRGKKQMVNITLMQPHSDNGFPIGVRVFDIEDGYQVSTTDKHQEYLYAHYEDGPLTVEEEEKKPERGCFIGGSSGSVTYALPSGRYLALLHMDDPSQQTNFSVTVNSACTLDIRKHNF